MLLLSRVMKWHDARAVYFYVSVKSRHVTKTRSSIKMPGVRVGVLFFTGVLFSFLWSTCKRRWTVCDIYRPSIDRSLAARSVKNGPWSCKSLQNTSQTSDLAPTLPRSFPRGSSLRFLALLPAQQHAGRCRGDGCETRKVKRAVQNTGHTGPNAPEGKPANSQK